MNHYKMILDLPFEIISQHILPYLDLQLVYYLSFNICHKWNQLPEFVESFIISVDDVATVVKYQRTFHQVILPKFRNIRYLEYTWYQDAYAAWPNTLVVDVQSFSVFSNLRSLRIPAFSRASSFSFAPYFNTSFIDHDFNYLFPLLEELWIDEYFNFFDPFCKSTDYIRQSIHWISNLPQSLQILRIKFQYLFEEENEDEMAELPEGTHPLQALPSGLRKLTTSAIMPFPNLSYLNQLEYLCLEQNWDCEDGYTDISTNWQYNIKDLTPLLPSTSLTSLHVINRQLNDIGIIPMIPSSVTDLTLRLNDEQYVPANIPLQGLMFPPQLTRLFIIGGEFYSPYFKLSHCRQLETFKQVLAKDEDDYFIRSLPVGQVALREKDRTVVTFDSLPFSSLRHLHLESMFPVIIHTTEQDVPARIDFWTMFDWNSHFPFLQSLFINIPMFIENLALLPETLKCLNLLLNPYKLPNAYPELKTIKPPFPYNGDPVLDLTDFQASSKVFCLGTYRSSPQKPSWKWPAALETLSLSLTSSWWHELPRLHSLPSSLWNNILTDIELQDPSSAFVKSLPSSLRELNLLNICMCGFPSFIFKLIEYQSNFESISWNPSVFDSMVFISSIMRSAGDATKIDDELLYFYASLLRHYSFPPYIKFNLNGYCEFDFNPTHSGLTEAQIRSCVSKIESFSLKPTKNPYQPKNPPLLNPLMSPNSSNEMQMLVSIGFREQLPELKSLKVLNLMDVEVRRAQIPYFRLDRVKLLPHSIPPYVEDLRLHTIKLELPPQDFAIDDLPTLDSLTSLSCSNLAEVQHTIHTSMIFARIFASVVHLELEQISLELLTQLKHLQSLVLITSDNWMYFDEWPINFDSACNHVVSTTDLASPNFHPANANSLPPSLTHLSIRRDAFDMILIGAPVGLCNVQMNCAVRLNVLESFWNSRATHEGLTLSFPIITFSPKLILKSSSWNPSLESDEWLEVNQLREKFGLDQSTEFQASVSHLMDINDLNSLPALSPELPPHDSHSSFFLACQLNYVGSTSFEPSSCSNPIHILGNPFLHLSSCIKSISLVQICIRYLKALKYAKSLESFAVKKFVLYNSEDVHMVRNPTTITNIVYEAWNNSRFVIVALSHQFDSTEDHTFAQSVCLGNHPTKLLVKTLKIWFPIQKIHT